MRVRINEARQQHSARKIDDPRPRADVASDACLSADENDVIALHGNCFGPWLFIFHRIDGTVSKYEVG